ncbi:MAG: glycosyltransferase family 2 protein [Planctomycetota bacterium]|nr:glycosyltransferase family 2 protein [Planctomycetota bacterium]
MSSEKALAEIRPIGYFYRHDIARQHKLSLFEKLNIPSATVVQRTGSYCIISLVVAPPDYEPARRWLENEDSKHKHHFPVEEYEQRLRELEKDMLFYDDRHTFVSENQQRTLERPPCEQDVAYKVGEKISHIFGESEAKKMTETLTQQQKEEDSSSAHASIIILMHNKWEHTRRCLRSLFDTTGVNFELILVDNGSVEPEMKKGVREYMNECLMRDIPVRLLTFKENVGAVRGRNEAIPYCTGRYIVFMDNDIVVRTKSWLKRMTGFLADHPNVGAVGCKLLYPNKPYLIQNAGCDVSPTGRVDFRGRGEKRTEEEFDSTRKVQCLISACICFPRSVVQEVGLLDMAYHPVQFEDIDYCYRIKDKGYDLYYLADVEMYHFENVTTGGTKSLNYTYLTVKNGKVFKDKWQHMFSKENGPKSTEMEWKDIEVVNIKDIGELEKLD